LAKLIIYEEIPGEEAVFEDFELLANRILIGSSPDNQLVLEAPDIDPTHASLELRYDHWVLQDLGAPGGTAVNGREISGPYALRNGDLIELGLIKLKFYDMEIAVEAEPAEPSEAEVEPALDPPMRGRIWFAQVTGGTLLIVVLILVLLLTAHYLGLLNIADLLPHWLPKIM
jgi:hypothetical protein